MPTAIPTPIPTTANPYANTPAFQPPYPQGGWNALEGRPTTARKTNRSTSWDDQRAALKRARAQPPSLFGTSKRQPNHPRLARTTVVLAADTGGCPHVSGLFVTKPQPCRRAVAAPCASCLVRRRPKVLPPGGRPREGRTSRDRLNASARCEWEPGLGLSIFPIFKTADFHF